MKINIGTADRALRIAIGICLIVATLFGFIGAWGWIGVVPLLTSMVGFCPLYKVFKFSSVDGHME